MSGPPYDAARLRQVAGEIVSTAHELAARGWTPATSSNFSMRLDEAHAAIAVSGLDKGRLIEEGVMVVDLDGPLACGGDEEARSACLRMSSYHSNGQDHRSSLLGSECSPDGMKWNPGHATGSPGFRCASSGLRVLHKAGSVPT